ncbi:hypothetical protein GLAREA_09611 [Glarea lozoyensis ATCC 20868]|nr:uncharacterized protein GLAREA_09611 [Glarea lozoyensis ATCC 20868]EPE28490.1 hypothetical protein GLAREA_09611 [Glarea lozoyensis ATCC 20868]
MCCQRRAARRAHCGNSAYQNATYQRRPTLIRMLIDHMIRKHEEKRALRQAMAFEPAVEKRGTVDEGPFSDEARVGEEGRVSEESEWDWVDEKREARMMMGQRAEMRLESREGMGLPSYEVAVGKV